MGREDSGKGLEPRCVPVLESSGCILDQNKVNRCGPQASLDTCDKSISSVPRLWTTAVYVSSFNEPVKEEFLSLVKELTEVHVEIT